MRLQPRAIHRNMPVLPFLLCAVPALGQTTHIVEVLNFEFVPQEVTALPGDTIRWVWVSGLHTVTSGTNCVFDNGPLDVPIDFNNPQFEFVIPDGSGDIPYFCRFHCFLGMEGTIFVVSNATIEDARSLLTHGAGPGVELAIDLDNSSGIEPRQGGPTRLAFTMSEDINILTVVPANVQIVCGVGPDPVVSGVTLEVDNRTVTVELASAPADKNCCTFTFAGMQTTAGGSVEGSFDVVALQGDVNFSGAVSGADPSIIKPFLGQPVNPAAPQFDYNRSGAISGADPSLIKPLLGNLPAGCP